MEEIINREEKLNLKGKNIQNVRIVSENCFFLPPSIFEDDSRQEIIIDASGNVKVKRQRFRKWGDGRTIEKKSFSVGSRIAGMIIKKLQDFFDDKDPCINMAFDVGKWKISFGISSGESAECTGSLFIKEYELAELSGIIRDALDMQTLLVFDGNSRGELIDELTIDFDRTTRERNFTALCSDRIVGENAAYHERVTLDRNEGVIVHELSKESDKESYQKKYVYIVGSKVRWLLDSLDSKIAFTEMPEQDEDDCNDIDENDLRKYSISLNIRNTGIKTIEDDFEYYTVPVDFEDFAKQLKLFVKSYKEGLVISYTPQEPYKPEYFDCGFVTVRFDKSERRYTYKYDPNKISVKIGDEILVPVGYSDKPKKVTVTEIEDGRTIETDEYPYDIAKWIIGFPEE